jgi:hypothetical protein
MRFSPLLMAPLAALALSAPAHSFNLLCTFSTVCTDGTCTTLSPEAEIRVFDDPAAMGPEFAAVVTDFLLVGDARVLQGEPMNGEMMDLLDGGEERDPANLTWANGGYFAEDGTGARVYIISESENDQHVLTGMWSDDGSPLSDLYVRQWMDQSGALHSVTANGSCVAPG